MKILKNLFLVLLLCLNSMVFSQSFSKQKFSRADTLRGMLTPLRTCYDINYYHLDVKIDIDKKFISGSNLFRFTATQDFKTLQFDLFKNMRIQKILFEGNELKFTREFNAVFIEFPQIIKKGEKQEFSVEYEGNTLIARNAPWDGGFTFTSDNSGKPVVSVACQELGASSWWPTKDHQADEVDSMLISISVPDGLMDVSNGRLRSVDKLPDNYNRYNWFVSYPINNYTVALNIANYTHFNDVFKGEKGNLTLDYYVLPQNLEKAKIHFNADVKPMLKCFENWFGPYPFYRDGYKLIETNYMGMEDQSATAYGNNYLKGYLGTDRSGTGFGLKWDYIIVHESGHEWFGNNITSKDIADMWIHEAFTTYSEGLFVEYYYGKENGAKYIAGQRLEISNKAPIIGTYNVNKSGSSDMYFKGTNMLHTIRSVINNDALWRNILRGLNLEFGLKTVTTNDIVKYINVKSGKDLTKIFDQYLKYTAIPVLETKNEGKNIVSYRWKADVSGFNMPVKVKIAENQPWIFISPSADAWKNIELGPGTNSLIIDTENFYIETKILSAN